MHGQIYLCAIALLMTTGAAGAQSSMSSDQRCSEAMFETDAAAALEACKAMLARADLTDAARASAMKVEGRALHKLGRLDEAIRTFEAALTLAPRDPELHVRRGWTAYNKRDLQLVFDHVTVALGLKPDSADAYDLMGAALTVSGPDRFADAKAAYQQAVNLDPSKPMPRVHLYQLLNRNYPEEALREVDAMLQLPAAVLTSGNGTDWFKARVSFRTLGNLARIPLLERLGRRNEAREAADRAVTDDPREAITWASRAEFNLLSSAPEAAAQADIEKSIALDPKLSFPRYVQAKIHFYGKRYDAAAADFALAARLDPVQADVRWWHALALRELGRVDEASLEAVAAFRVEPNFIVRKGPALQKLGYLVLPRSDKDAWTAIEDAARACMLDKDCS